uniref:Uncharacterized protein n=1 Tax=Brassica oleracea var. oleracea TaxID=109376 RepID=A0A0D3CCC8_BRAOL
MLGLFPLQKCTAAIRVLAYGSAADAVDEYLRLCATITRSCLENFVDGIISLFSDEYLRRLISCIFLLFYPFTHVHFDHIDYDLAVFRLHFEYMSLYQHLTGATSPERHHQVALISLSDRPYQSDREESLAF